MKTEDILLILAAIVICLIILVYALRKTREELSEAKFSIEMIQDREGAYVEKFRLLDDQIKNLEKSLKKKKSNKKDIEIPTELNDFQITINGLKIEKK